MSDRPEANLPIIAGQEQTVAASFLGLHSDLSSPDQLESNIVYSGTASGDARQIVGPVSTTFTGPIERVEAHFTLRANDEVPKTTFKFLKWLSPLNQSAIHSTNLRSQAPGTGSWFLEGCEFQTWLREPASLLWIHGGGKKSYHYSASYEAYIFVKLAAARLYSAHQPQKEFEQHRVNTIQSWALCYATSTALFKTNSAAHSTPS